MCEERVSRGEAVYARISHVNSDQAQAAMATRVGSTHLALAHEYGLDTEALTAL